jgi:tetratricopeptide (TPR) repeat protein
MRWVALLAVSITLACGGSTSVERRADGEVAEGRWNEAFASYRSAVERQPEGRVLGKLGVAALRVGKLNEAAAAFARMGSEDPSRQEEAADGLELVARSAERAGDTAALRIAIDGLRDVAPNRPVGRFVLALETRGALAATDRLELTAAAVGAAPDGDTADSLLLQYAAVLRDAHDCERASRIYQAVAMRSTLKARATTARHAEQDCALRVGKTRLEAGAPADALAWLEEAIKADSASRSGVTALEAMATALTALGDTVGGTLVQAVAERYRAALPDSGSAAR